MINLPNFSFDPNWTIIDRYKTQGISVFDGLKKYKILSFIGDSFVDCYITDKTDTKICVYYFEDDKLLSLFAKMISCESIEIIDNHIININSRLYKILKLKENIKK